MTRIYRRVLFTLFICFSLLTALRAQKPLIFSTGGTYGGAGNQVKLYSYHPKKDTVYIQDSVPGDFSNDVLYDGEYYYLHVGRASGHPAGGDAIYQYDEHNFDVVDSIQPISGAQAMEVKDDHLVVTRGFGASSEFVRVYDRNNLSAGPTYAKDSISANVNGLTIKGDSAYLGYTKNDSGHIATLDLAPATPALDTIYKMDTLSAGVNALAQDSDHVYALSERYDGMTLMYAAATQFDPMTGSYNTDTNSYGSNSPVMARNDSVWLNVDTPMNVYDAAAGSFPEYFPVDFSAGTFNSKAKRFYFQRTDFSTTGDFLITDASGARLDSFSTDISGAALSLADSIRTMAGTDTTICADQDLMLNGYSSTDSAKWMSSGTGSFSDPDSLTTTYMPSAADTASGSVQLTFISADTGRFEPDTSQLMLSFKSVPVVDAGMDTNYCVTRDTIGLNGSVSGSFTDFHWNSLGDGAFEDSSVAGTDYYPGSNDTANGMVDLVLEATNGGDCPVLDTVKIQLQDKAEASIAGNDPYCTPDDTVSVSGNSNTGAGEWFTKGTGSFQDSSSLSTAYYMSSADVSNGGADIGLATKANSGCTPDTAMVSLVLGPSVDAGMDTNYCETVDSVALNGNVGGSYTAFAWSSSGDGVFEDTTVAATDYAPGSNDKSSGGVNLILEATNGGNCPKRDTVHITLDQTPKASISGSDPKCSTDDTLALAGNSNTGAGLWFTKGTGSFQDSSSLSTSYYMSGSDVSNGTVDVGLETMNNGACPSDTSMLTLKVKPSVDAGSDISTTVSTNSVTLNGSVGNAADSYEWSTYGTGSFADKTALGTDYQPSQQDKDLGSVNLKLSVWNDGSCENSDAVNIDFTDTDIEDSSKDEASLKLRPVPANEELIVNSSSVADPEQADYAIMDLTGRVLREGSLELGSETHLQVEALPQGSYFLKVRTDDTEFVRKWMKR